MIYLDNSATTRAFDEVCEELAQISGKVYYNISSPYSCALKAEKLFLGAKKTFASVMNANESEILFTSGGTESDNTALFCAKPNSEVIVSAGEHHAVLNTIKQLESIGCKVHICPLEPSGTVNVKAVEEKVNENTSLVSIMHVNNETGAINDIKAISDAIKRKNPKTIFHSDGVQAFMHTCSDMKALGVDMYSVSAHKLHGPKGVGLLYVKNGTPFKPFIYGGGQQNNLRSGTVNLPGIAAFETAVKKLGSAEEFSKRLENVKDAYTEKLLRIEGAHLTIQKSAPNIISLCIPGIKASSLQNAIEDSVIIGKGSACTSRSSKISHVLEAMGIERAQAEATVRISLGWYNTLQEVDEAVEKINTAVQYLRKYRRK